MRIATSHGVYNLKQFNNGIKPIETTLEVIERHGDQSSLEWLADAAEELYIGYYKAVCRAFRVAWNNRRKRNEFLQLFFGNFKGDYLFSMNVAKAA